MSRAAVCKNPSDYQGNKKLPGSNATCDFMASSSQYPLTSETKNCSSTPYDAEYPSATPRYATNMLTMYYGCCGTGRGACQLDYAAAVCKNPSDYQGNKQITVGSYVLTCDSAAMQSPLTSAKDCSPSSQAKHHVDQMVTGGCCGAGKGACSLDYS